MPSTYTPIATQTLGSSAATVTFSSISGSYTDLILIISGTNTAGGENLLMQFNGDTGSNYSRTILLGNGSTATSVRASSVTEARIGQVQTTPSTTIANVMNYSNTTTNKTVLSRDGNAGANTQANVNLWRSTSAITSILIYQSSSANFLTGSTFTLYGIKAA
jgi:hypothetical protein